MKHRPTKKRLAASRRQRAWLRRLPPALRKDYERERARQARQRWRIEVVYTGGLDYNLDQRIELTAKRGRSGSGYYFPKNMRDMDFYFVQRPAAMRALRRLRRLRPRPKTWKVTLHPVNP